MQFFNFGNTATFHVFRWVTEYSGIDLDEAIVKAFAAAETDEGAAAHTHHPNVALPSSRAGP